MSKEHQRRLGYAIVEPSVFGDSSLLLAQAEKGSSIWTTGDFRGGLCGLKGLKSPNGVCFLSMIRVIKGEKVSEEPAIFAPDRYELAIFMNEKTTRLVLGSHLIFSSHEALTEVYEGITGFVGTHKFVVKNVSLTETLWKLEGQINPPLPDLNFVSREWVHTDDVTGTAVGLVKWRKPNGEDTWAYVMVGNATGFIFTVPFIVSPDFGVDRVTEDVFDISVLCHGQVRVFGATSWRDVNGFGNRKSAFTPYPQEAKSEAPTV